MSFLMNTQKNVLAVEFAIADNKELFRQLYEKMQEIEAVAEIILDWCELPDRDKWVEQFEWIKKYSEKIAGVFRQFL